MPQFLVAIHHTDDYDPSKEREAVAHDIDTPPHHPRAKYPVSSMLGHTKKH
jgi:hypothetical protein